MPLILNDILLAGKTLRNRSIFDIYDKKIDYYSFVKNVDYKNLYNKNILSLFIQGVLPSIKNIK